MRLSGEQLAHIIDALLSGYSSLFDLELMVRIKLNRNLSTICGGQNLEQTVFQLVTWAESHGELDNLITGAFEHNPGNTDLGNLFDSYQTWKFGGSFRRESDTQSYSTSSKMNLTILVSGGLGILTIIGIVLIYSILKPTFLDEGHPLEPSTASPTHNNIIVESTPNITDEDELASQSALDFTIKNERTAVPQPSVQDKSIQRFREHPVVSAAYDASLFDRKSKEEISNGSSCTVLNTTLDDPACRIEFGWTGGSANGDNSNVFTFVDVIELDLQAGSGGAGLRIKYDWMNGILNGGITFDGRYSGFWLQDDSDGGEFELILNPEGTEATGWWNYKGTPLENRAILRVNKRQ